jgi:hypothetical protein
MAGVMDRNEIIARRQAFWLQGYMTLDDVGLDGEYVSPPQMTSCSLAGPVLLAYHWIDASSAVQYRNVLKQYGYLPGMTFNKIVDASLALASKTRADVYITQAFHLLPDNRSARIPARDIDACMDQVGVHELSDRRVIALGGDVARACKRAGIHAHEIVPHPSAYMTPQTKIELLAGAIGRLS